MDIIKIRSHGIVQLTFDSSPVRDMRRNSSGVLLKASGWVTELAALAGTGIGVAIDEALRIIIVVVGRMARWPIVTEGITMVGMRCGGISHEMNIGSWV